jgi:hypothetical protein
MTSTQTRHRSFSTKKAQTAPPVTFDLNDEATFTCRAQVPGTVLLEHVERLSDGKTAASELLRIWRDVFDEEEHGRFRAYVDAPESEVDVQDLGEVLTFVLGELSGRPTNASSPSSRGRSTTGTTSPSASSGSGKRRKASTS